MKYYNQFKPVLYGGATILVANLIYQEDWSFTLLTAVAFAIGALIVPPVITFMSDYKKDSHCR